MKKYAFKDDKGRVYIGSRLENAICGPDYNELAKNLPPGAIILPLPKIFSDEKGMTYFPLDHAIDSKESGFKAPKSENPLALDPVIPGVNVTFLPKALAGNNLSYIKQMAREDFSVARYFTKGFVQCRNAKYIIGLIEVSGFEQEEHAKKLCLESSLRVKGKSFMTGHCLVDIVSDVFRKETKQRKRQRIISTAYEDFDKPLKIEENNLFALKNSYSMRKLDIMMVEVF